MKNPATGRAGEPMFQAAGRASTKALGQERIHCLLLERPKEAKMVGYGVLESLQIGMEKLAEPGQAPDLDSYPKCSGKSWRALLTYFLFEEYG